MSSEISTKAESAVIGASVKYFVNQMLSINTEMGNVCNRDELQRLTMSAVVAAIPNLAKANLSWKDIDATTFQRDLYKEILYGMDAGNGEVFLYPKKKDNKQYLMVHRSAKGMAKVVTDFSVNPVEYVKAIQVKKGDKLKIVETSQGTDFEFEPIPFSDAPLVGVVTVVVYKSGVRDIELTSISEVEKRHSKGAPNSAAWKDWYNEMSEAKAMRKHMDRIPVKIADNILRAEKEVDEKFPTMKDCGDLDAPKIETAYPTAETAEEYVDDFDLYVGTPLGEEAK